MDFNTVTKFENKIAEFFGSPYAVAVDCCTHGIELCLRHENFSYIEVPKKNLYFYSLFSQKNGNRIKMER